MPAQDKAPLRNRNRYNAESACGHCGEVIRHEPWCMTQNSDVLYAYRIIANPSSMNTGDRLILHALGVSWTAKRLR